jgi:serine/threonine-protein kinase
MPLPSDLLCARVVVQRGFATEERVRECLELQAKNRAVGYDESLHAVLLKRGFLSSDDARRVERELALLQFVRSERIFARIVVEKGLATPDLGRELLLKQKEDGWKQRLGDMLIERRVLTKATRDEIASEQVKRLEAEDEQARRAELDPGAAAAPPRPPLPPSGIGLASDDGEVTVSQEGPSASRAADGAMAAFRRDQRKFGSGEYAPPAPPSGGIAIPGYEILDRSGQGSVGVVWRARPKGGGPNVAIKVLSPSLTRNPELLARFQKAFARASAIEHPALVKLGKLESAGELHYYTMELVDGESLEARVERAGPLPATRVRELAKEVARALAHIHGQRVLHGGLRPSNILLGRDGSVKVADLILARIAPRLAGEADTDKARLYASPEDLTGAAGADPRDDIYSYGLVLYYALVGRHAFPDAQPSARLAGPADPRDADQLADEALSAIVIRATAPSRDGRYRDAHELLKNLSSPRSSDPENMDVRELGVTVELPPPKLAEVGGPIEDTAAKREKDRAREEEESELRASKTDAIVFPPPGVDSSLGSAKLRRGIIDTTDETIMAPAPPSRGRRRTTQAPLPGPSGADLTGQTVNGRYKIKERLGEGGMGVVYRAEHTLMAKDVAFKVLHPSLVKSEESVARFQREVMAMAQFAHKNVVRIYDAGRTEDGRLYMAMELIEGRDLAAILDEGPVTPLRTVMLLRQILRAVGEGHAKGIVHRDLKPENILITTGAAGEEVVKVMDFGIAKILESDDPGSGATASGGFRTVERVVLGTPEYMSPEQASGTPVDHRSDLYSLGCIAYEMLLGRMPFDADSPVGFIGKHIVDPPLTFEEAQPGHGHSAAVEAFIMKALEKDPGERFQSAEEMLRALEEAAPEEAQAAAMASLEAKAVYERGSDSRRQGAGASAAKLGDAPSSRKMTKVVPTPAVTPGPPAASAAAKSRATSARTAGGPGAKSSPAAAAKKSSPLVAVVAVLVLLALGLGVGALVLFLKHEPFEKKLASAQAISDAASAKGDWDGARGAFDPLLAGVAAGDPHEKTIRDLIAGVEAKRAAALQEKSRHEVFDKAVAEAEELLGKQDVSSETALRAAIARAGDTGVEPAKAADLERRVRGWKMRAEEALGENLVQRPENLEPAISHLTAARDSAEGADQKRLDDRIGVVKGILSFEQAKRALEKKQFDEAERLAMRAVNAQRTPDAERLALVEEIKAKRIEFERSGRTGQIDALVEEGNGLARNDHPEEALGRFKRALDEANRPPVLSDRKDQVEKLIAAVTNTLAALAAWDALPKMPEPGASRPDLVAAKEAREKYAADFPDGPRTKRAQEEAKDLASRLVDDVGRVARATFEDAVARVHSAVAADDLPAAKAAIEKAKEAAAKLGPPEQELAARLPAEIESRIALQRELRKEYVLVPAGKRPRGYSGDPLPAFYLGVVEVTNSSYLKFCIEETQAAAKDLEAAKDPAKKAEAEKRLDAAKGRWPDAWDNDPGGEVQGARMWPASAKANNPVTGVSFLDAQAYCVWLSASAKGRGLKIRYRLPHEVEWERAASGDKGFAYPWGNAFAEDKANWRADETAPGDARLWARGQSPFGALHMSGNAAEWVDDPGTGPDGKPALDTRLVKGGSYRTFKPDNLAVTGPSSREKVDMTARVDANKYPVYGFRVLAELTQE